MALPPGPPLPASVQTALYLTKPIEFLEGCHRRYGDLVTIETLLFGREVAVVDPEHVKQVFTSDPSDARAGEANAFLEPLVGARSVLLLDGQAHLRERRRMMPPFHGERMTAYARVMREITEQVVDTFPTDRPFALHPYMQRITLDIILRTVFGVEQGADLDALRASLIRLLDRQASTIGALSTIPMFRRSLFGLSPWDGFLRDRDRADALIHAQIARRRADRSPRSDVLSMLLEARDEEGRPMTDAELRDELMTLLAAGHETTAGMLCWAFELILGDGRVAARLRNEARDVGPEAAARLEYTDATVKEALRLHPVIPAVGRRLHAPMTLGKYVIPAGMLVVPSVYLTHRLASLYPEPTAFRPERFLDKKPDPYAWYPFGGGVRRCLGMAFALYEMKIVIATILSRVRLRKAHPAPERTVIRAISFVPERGAEVVLEAKLGAGATAAAAA
ncbi:cytochrome P450 [Minicystis rosea]|nr:cytochrome P450 [Minicystis rosea]